MDKINSTDGARSFIRTLCQMHNVRYDMLLVGYSRTYTKNEKRYCYSVGDALLINSDVRYVMKYFLDGDMFVIWDTRKSKTRSKFSASYQKVQDAIVRTHELTKAVEYSGWGEESVLVIPRTEMESFIASLK